MDNNKVDFTINGECSKCGLCCQAILTISEKEIQKIKSYIGKNKINPINRHSIVDKEFIDICPFLTEDNECLIYSVRPEVCKRFLCSQYKTPDAPYFNHMDKTIVNMYDVFLGDSYYPKPELDLKKENLKYSLQKKELSRKISKKW